MEYSIQRGNLTRPLYFLMVLSSDHITGATGKSPTVTLLKSGAAAFAAPAGAVTEIGNGIYAVAPNATDAETLGPLMLHATAAACDPRDASFEVLQDLSAAAVALSPSSASTLALTANTIIAGALKLLRVLAPGEEMAPEDANDGLVRLNELVDEWNTQGRMVTGEVANVYSLTTAAAYTIGPGGTFNQAWPQDIARAYIRYTVGSSVLDIPLTKLTPEGYARIPIKALTNPWPLGFYYDRAYSSGLGTLTFYPVPDGTQSLSVVLWTRSVLAQFASLATTYAFAPGYAKALRYNLASDLEADHGATLSPKDAQTARDTKALIKRGNTTLLDLSMDVAVTGGGGRSNVYTGEA